MSCADVCLDMYCDKPSEFFAERIVAGRKEYECVECREPIPKGAKHEVFTGATDGVFYRERTCLLCVEIRKAFVCGTFVFEQLWPTIEEEMFPRWNEVGPYDCLAKLTSEAAVKKINERYRQWRGTDEPE